MPMPAPRIMGASSLVGVLNPPCLSHELRRTPAWAEYYILLIFQYIMRMVNLLLFYMQNFFRF